MRHTSYTRSVAPFLALLLALPPPALALRVIESSENPGRVGEIRSGLEEFSDAERIAAQAEGMGEALWRISASDALKSIREDRVKFPQFVEDMAKEEEIKLLLEQAGLTPAALTFYLFGSDGTRVPTSLAQGTVITKRKEAVIELLHWSAWLFHFLKTSLSERTLTRRSLEFMEEGNVYASLNTFARDGVEFPRLDEETAFPLIRRGWTVIGLSSIRMEQVKVGPSARSGLELSREKRVKVNRANVEQLADFFRELGRQSVLTFPIASKVADRMAEYVVRERLRHGAFRNRSDFANRMADSTRGLLNTTWYVWDAISEHLRLGFMDKQLFAGGATVLALSLIVGGTWWGLKQGTKHSTHQQRQMIQPALPSRTPPAAPKGGLEEGRAVEFVQRVREFLAGLEETAPAGVRPMVIGQSLREMDQRLELLTGLEEQGLFLHEAGEGKGPDLVVRILEYRPRRNFDTVAFAGLEEEAQEIRPLLQAVGLQLKRVDLSSGKPADVGRLLLAMVAQAAGIEEAARRDLKMLLDDMAALAGQM